MAWYDSMSVYGRPHDNSRHKVKEEERFRRQQINEAYDALTGKKKGPSVMERLAAMFQMDEGAPTDAGAVQNNGGRLAAMPAGLNDDVYYSDQEATGTSGGEYFTDQSPALPQYARSLTGKVSPASPVNWFDSTGNAIDRPHVETYEEKAAAAQQRGAEAAAANTGNIDPAQIKATQQAETSTGGTIQQPVAQQIFKTATDVAYGRLRDDIKAQISPEQLAQIASTMGWIESSWRPDVEGTQLPDGTKAQGLMQVTPTTAENTAKQWGMNYADYNPKSAQHNANMGLMVLVDNLNRTNGNVEEAVAQYHGGTSKANHGDATKGHVNRFKQLHPHISTGMHPADAERLISGGSGKIVYDNYDPQSNTETAVIDEIIAGSDGKIPQGSQLAALADIANIQNPRQEVALPEEVFSVGADTTAEPTAPTGADIVNRHAEEGAQVGLTTEDTANIATQRTNDLKIGGDPEPVNPETGLTAVQEHILGQIFAERQQQSQDAEQNDARRFAAARAFSLAGNNEMAARIMGFGEKEESGDNGWTLSDNMLINKKTGQVQQLEGKGNAAYIAARNVFDGADFRAVSGRLKTTGHTVRTLNGILGKLKNNKSIERQKTYLRTVLPAEVQTAVRSSIRGGGAGFFSSLLHKELGEQSGDIVSRTLDAFKEWLNGEPTADKIDKLLQIYENDLVKQLEGMNGSYGPDLRYVNSVNRSGGQPLNEREQGIADSVELLDSLQGLRSKVSERQNTVGGGGGAQPPGRGNNFVGAQMEINI